MPDDFETLFRSIEALGPDARSRLLARLSDATFDLNVDLGKSGSAGGPSLPPVASALTPEAPGRYTVVETIGEGGFGTVVACHDAHLNREVARKEIRQATGRGQEERFLREARITARLAHPSIVPVYELGQAADGRVYYTMKRIHGSTLKAAIQSRRARERLELLGPFVAVCHAIGYAHSRGVLHRDIKPANVILGAFGETLVVDWGIARVAGFEPGTTEASTGSVPNDPTLFREVSEGGTLQGTVFGTPAYMSPEQARGAIDRLDARSDVWSLGAMLYEILTGRPPYSGTDSLDVVRQATVGRIPDPRVAAAESPRELCAIVVRACRAEPAGRYPSAEALAADVEAWRTGGRVLAYDYSRRELAERFVARNGPAVTVAGVGLAVLLTVAAVSWGRVATERDRAVASETRTATAETAAREELRSYLVNQAKEALGERRNAEAAIYGARALQLGEDPEARGAVIAAANAWAPTLLWQADTACDQVAVADGGRTVACATEHGVSVWGGAGLSQAQRWLTNHNVLDVAFEPGGRRLAVAIQDLAVVQVLDVGTGTETSRWPGFRFPGTSGVSWDRHGLWVRSDPWDFSRIDLSGGSSFHVGEVGDYEWDRVARAEDGSLAVTASGDGIHVWKVGADGATPVASAPRSARSVTVTRSGDTVAAADGGGATPIRLYSTATMTPRGTLPGHTGGVSAVAALLDERELLSVGQDGSLALWDLDTEALAARTVIDTQPISVLTVSADGGFAGTTSDLGFTRAWRLPTANLAEVPTFGSAVARVAWSPDGRTLAACGRDGAVRVLDTVNGGFVASTDPVGQRCWGIWFDDGEVTALLATRGLIRPFLEAPARLVETSAFKVSWASVDPTGRWRAVAGLMTTLGADNAPTFSLDVVVTHATSGLIAGRYTLPSARLTWAPDGNAILALQPDCTANLWQVSDGKPGPNLPFPTSCGIAPGSAVMTSSPTPRSVAWSPDGALLAWGKGDGFIDVLSGTDFKHVSSLGSETDPVTMLAWSPDGQVLAAAGFRDSVALWNVATGTLVARLRGGHGQPGHLVFSPDGKRLATGYPDGTVRIWDLADVHIPGSAALSHWLQRLGLRLTSAVLEPDPSWTSRAPPESHAE